jgi:hypothetical protein
MNFLLCAAVIILMIAYTISRIRFWQSEGAKLHQSGYVPPQSFFGHFLVNLASRIVCWWVAGPMHVIDRERLYTSGRILMVAGNHQDETDFALPQLIFSFINRYLMAENQLYGYREPLAALAGVIAVKYEQRDGQEVVSNGGILVKTQSDLLIQDPDACLGIFPEGEMNRKNDARVFKTGTVRMFRKVVRATGDNTAVIQTVGIHFLRHPNQATWFHKLVLRYSQCPQGAGALQLLLHKFVRATRLHLFRSTFGHTNYGVIVAIGDAIPYTQIPDNGATDDKEFDAKPGTEILRQTVKDALVRAQAEDEYLAQWTTTGRPEIPSISPLSQPDQTPTALKLG